MIMLIKTGVFPLIISCILYVLIELMQKYS